MLRTCIQVPVSKYVRFTYLKTFRRFNGTAANAASIPANLLSLKVAKIVHIEEHPNADSLYVSKVQIEENGLDQQRNEEASSAATAVAESRCLTVCSGLRNFLTTDQLLNKKIVIVNNLKPSKLRGVKSEAMVLVAEKTGDGTSDTQIELIKPPKNSKVGNSLIFQKLSSLSQIDGINEKQTMSEPTYKRIKDLKKLAILLDGINTNDSGMVNFNDEYFLVDPTTGNQIAYTTKVFNANVR